jgi:hypothetical protein
VENLNSALAISKVWIIARAIVVWALLSDLTRRIKGYKEMAALLSALDAYGLQEGLAQQAQFA